MTPHSANFGKRNAEQFPDGWWILPGVLGGVLLWVPIVRFGWQIFGG